MCQDNCESPTRRCGEGRGGLWRLANGQSIHVTVAFAVKQGTQPLAARYLDDYDRYQLGTLSGGDLLNKYPSLANAFALQIAYEGVHVLNQPGFPRNDFHGRETPVRRPNGAPDSVYTEECPGRESRQVIVNSREYSWFDFDCDYCSGPWDWDAGLGEARLGGLFHKTWNAEAPPPNPNLNVSGSYNFSDNPDRRVTPTGDHQITLAWDNLSEVTPDPKSECFDFRGYRVWKVSDWTRPVGAAGPGEADWKLIGEFRLFDYEADSLTADSRVVRVPLRSNYAIDTVMVNGERRIEKRCPRVFVPNYVRYDSLQHRTVHGDSIPICLDRGDLWDKQSGQVIKPDTGFKCIPDARFPDGCDGAVGGSVHRGASTCKDSLNRERRDRYPVGRYQFVDREVKNGFVYFYSVTALDSVTDQGITTELEGRRSAVESEAVAPQVSARTGKQVWVVPNPYRGYPQIARRSSTWDLTPNASDPTGTHIDFMGLPPGAWTIKIYTLAGDLVAELHSTDPVNESLRASKTVGSPPRTVPGYNRQQDYANDGQARWNLISRNGQDIVSGIYLFTVDSSQGSQRGKFVVIR
jgi:hypothetical protein